MVKLSAHVYVLSMKRDSSSIDIKHNCCFGNCAIFSHQHIFSLSEIVIMISLILSAIISFGFSINQGITIGSRTEKTGIKIKKP